MTGWAAGSAKNRREMIAHLKTAGLTAVVIALKEFDGSVFFHGAAEAEKVGAPVNAIPDLSACARDFKNAGIYTIGRVVVFEDNTLARRRPELAVHLPNGKLWTNHHGVAWVDPYRKEVWNYNLEIAEKAAQAGFDEIQFDYIRFPSDGPVNLCRYSRADHTKKTAAQNLIDFLDAAAARLRPLGAKLSIAIFGLTTTDDSGMGIGQHLPLMIARVDAVSPMMYPSHYHKGEYGIPNPNRDPYKTIHLGLKKAASGLGPLFSRLRPYLQDFSLGYHYGPQQVRAQILAAARMGVTNWILWNPQNRYTWSAIPSQEELDRAKTAPPTAEENSDQQTSSSTRHPS